MADSKQKMQLLVNDYVVCLVDILGQSDKLKRWPELPTGDNPSQELKDALKKTAQTVVRLRRLFESFFSQSEAKPLPKSEIEQFTEEQRREFHQTTDCHLSSRQFSDTLIFYAPLSDRYGDVTMFPMRRMLTTCARLMTIGLASKVPIRGALSVGPCVQLDGGDLYGPALAEAHHIEGKIASYPRIVVSDGAMEFITASFSFSPIAQIDAANHDMADQCRAFTCDDTDGRVIVDFMGERVKALDSLDGNSLPIEDAYQFVQSETRRFAESGEKEHEERYRQLLHYIESRLSLWGLSPETLTEKKPQ